jgi:DNA-binding response OmpR family regulator
LAQGRGRRVSMRILVVEDDRSLAASLQRVLESAGFACDVAFDGSAGCLRAQSGDYALIVMDILLPEMNGFRVCAELRRGGLDVPILMLTAKAGEWDEAESLDTGADDYLTKPASMTVFLAHVRALIRRSRLFHQRQIELDGMILDPLRRLCASQGIEVSLSGREAEVLAALMLARGGVVDKAELVNKVWGAHFKGDRNIVEVYVRHLRRKLEPTLGRQLIATVHGVGYRFCVRESARDR